MATVLLREIANSRGGDKGNISNLSLIPYEGKYYEILKEKVTAKAVKDYFKGICLGKVTRYELDGIEALNFVLEDALDGGNTVSLRVDSFGKSLCTYLLSMKIDLPD